MEGNLRNEKICTNSISQMQPFTGVLQNNHFEKKILKLKGMHLWIFFSFSESFFKEPFASVLRKACSKKLLKTCRKTTPVLESVVSQKRLLFLKRYPGISVFLWIVRTFSEQLFWRTLPEGCFCNSGGCLCLKRASC